MKSLLSTLLIASAALLFNCSPMGMRSGTDKNDMDGWHFHICSNDTQASRVWFEISGMGENSTYESHEVKWQRGRDTFITVPKAVRYMDDLNLSIRTSGKRRARICVLYGEYVVKSLEVTGTESNKLNKDSNRDNCPC
jgi:hypothetical protein